MAQEVAVFANIVLNDEHFARDSKKHIATVVSEEVQGNFLTSRPAPEDPFSAELEAPVNDIRPLPQGSEWKLRSPNPIMRKGEIEWYVLVPADEDAQF